MNTVVIWAEHWDEMRLFYSTLLDGSEIASSAEFVQIVGDANEVFLHRVPGAFTAPAAIREDAAIKPVFSLSVLPENAETILKRFEHDGWTYLDLVDPDGNVVSTRTLKG